MFGERSDIKLFITGICGHDVWYLQEKVKLNF